MKVKILMSAVLSLTLIATAFAGTKTLEQEKPVVANIATTIEQQIVYEVPLGSYVKKGQLVLAVDSTIEHAKVLSDVAAIQYNKRIYRDAAVLVKAHTVSQEEYLQDKYNLAKAIEQYTIDRNNELHCKDYAPFNGVVTSISAYPGSGLGDGNTVMTIKEV